MAKRNWTLAPPDSVSIEVFDWSHDICGNPTAHHLILWSNGERGAAWEGDHYRSRRRIQVGYGDKITGGLAERLAELFPGTVWRMDGKPEGDRSAGRAFVHYVRDHESEPVPVLFRKMRGKKYESDGVTAVFPTLPWTDSDLTVYAAIGQHGAASLDWLRRTVPAKPEEYAGLKRELEAEPYSYRLDVRSRWTPAMEEKRRAVYAAMREPSE